MADRDKVGFRTIRYMKKSAIGLVHTDESISEQAKAEIEAALPNDVLILRVAVNSPAYIEAALKLSQDNLRKIVEMD